ncbi:MAG: translation elongation factor Ts [Candidatus Aenigmarchaeota archaeon]|nr:translation elongation factor Ts [Candidatus Aenigmarchaeota archaeon]
MKEKIIELRNQTGAGIVDCKKALTASSGNIEKAIEILRKKGQKIVAAKTQREAKEGLIESYIHAGGKIGVLVEVFCETDFVARNEEFKELAHNLAMHIAAQDPQYLRKEDIPKDILDQERKIELERLKDSGKPKDILDKIVEGKLKKFFEETCLLEQTYIKDESKKIRDLIEEKISKFEENIKIGRFTKYQLGG